MSNQEPPHSGVRQGLKLLLIAGCLTPLIFLVEDLLPSRENTRLDELPQIVLVLGLAGLALAGVARIAYALLTEHRSRAISTSDVGSLPASAISELPLITPKTPVESPRNA